MRPAIFIDKDGTLVEDVPFNVDLQRVRLAPTAAEAIGLLASRGYAIVVITNQSGVARGLFDEARVVALGDYLSDLLREWGVVLAGFYFCPHLPDAAVARYRLECDCRKPAPGLIRRACTDLDIDPGASWMLGDIASDILAGHAAGCRTALINAEPNVELAALTIRPDVVAPDLITAAKAIAARTLQPSC